MTAITQKHFLSIRVFASQTGDKTPANAHNPFRGLSDEERIRQIGEILHRAARLHWRREREDGRASPIVVPRSPEPQDVTDLTADITEKNILRFLTAEVSASPAQIGARLALPHTTLVRKLARLKTCGLVVVTGKTKGARYELAGHQQRN